MSWVGRDFNGGKITMGRSRCRHVTRRPRMLDPAERLRRSVRMLELHERDGESVGTLAEWFGFSLSHTYECLETARAFRREMQRRKQHAEEVYDVA
jgi:hypothetical protein